MSVHIDPLAVDVLVVRGGGRSEGLDFAHAVHSIDLGDPAEAHIELLLLASRVFAFKDGSVASSHLCLLKK